MKLLVELEEPAGRFRLAQCIVGLLGCLCVSYAVWVPRWLGDQGLWTRQNHTEDSQSEGLIFNALEAERVFGALSFLMAVSSAALCVLLAACWTSQTARSYSNTRSLLMAGQALYPSTLLLLTLGPTGFFFLLTWSLFTYQHWSDITDDITRLGSSYWLGALGWVLLLAVLPAVYLAEQFVVPDVLPELARAMASSSSWRRKGKARPPYHARCLSEGRGVRNQEADASLMRVLSAP